MIFDYNLLLLLYFVKITGGRYNLTITTDNNFFDGDIKQYLNNNLKGNYIITSNHISSSDWFLNLHMASIFDSIGKIRYMMKKQIKYTPIGLICMNHDMIFLERNNINKDIKTIKNAISKANNDYWVLIYPEGTYTNPHDTDTLYKSKSFALNNNLPILHNILTPRTKGFELLSRGGFDGVIDVTMAFEKPYQVKLCKTAIPGLIKIFGNYEPLNIHLHLKKYDIKNINDANKFINKVWQEKDRLLEDFQHKQYFDGNHIYEYIQPRQYKLLIYGTTSLLYIWFYITKYYKYITFIYSSITAVIVLIMMLFELYQNYDKRKLIKHKKN
jgi:1-acyl-sn-glycerol-3-phosphate acyltransferase